MITLYTKILSHFKRAYACIKVIKIQRYQLSNKEFLKKFLMVIRKIYTLKA